MSEIDIKSLAELCKQIGEQKGVRDAPFSFVGGPVNQISNLDSESSMRFETIFEALSEGIVFQNQHRKIILNNQTSSRILGVDLGGLKDGVFASAGLVIKQEDGIIFPTELYPVAVALKTGIPQSNVVMNILRPDGTQIWIQVNSVPVFDQARPDPVAVVTSFSDISSMKAHETRLNQKVTDLMEAHQKTEERRQEVERAYKELRKKTECDRLAA